MLIMKATSIITVHTADALLWQYCEGTVCPLLEIVFDMHSILGADCTRLQITGYPYTDRLFFIIYIF
jgi:hypothetical protein